MKLNLLLILIVTVAVATACSFSTANLGDLKFAKDNKGAQTMTSGNVGEKVFAITPVQNNIGKVKVKFTLYFENVQGKNKGDKAANVDVDLDGNGDAIFNFTPPMPGDYKVEAVMVDESGKELGKKSGTINIKGEAPKPAATPAANKDADDAADEDN